jgi:cyclophilin family peptidyl-prolyl cis-trans isomerase/HEAT repeat protein
MLCSLLAVAVVLAPARVAAQESAMVEVLAPVLAAEDARAWRPEAFRAALGSADSLVRQTGAMAVGRVGDPRGVPLLLPLLIDPDTTVRVAAVFALGLIGDTAAVGPILDRLTAEPVLDLASAREAMTALARIGGRRVADFFSAALQGRASLAIADPAVVVPEIAVEAWRLGRAAPVTELLPLTRHENPDVRWRAVYSLGRLRAREAAGRLTEAMRDELHFSRAFAARAFTRAFADSAGLEADAAAAVLVPLVDDPDPGVRINAMASLATYDAGQFADRVIPRLNDPIPNVRVQAAATLGSMGGPDAVAALVSQLDRRVIHAVQREALFSLAAADTAAFARAAAGWARSADWRERMAAAQAAGGLGGRPAALGDRDARVVAAALAAWSDATSEPDAALVAAARAHLAHADAAVRSVAAGILVRAPDPADIPALARAYGRAQRDSFPDALLGALEGLAAIARISDSASGRVTREFLARTAAPSSYLVRRWAAERWPEAARRWGPAYPIETGRTMQDYREIARRYILATDSLRRPHVIIETEQRGSIEVELLGPEAPLTVASFINLVDRRFFDGNQWHRVIPNFVVQDGDPRGDGWGGPGPVIRDEINRVRYRDPVLGMALSGPDTGSSQWFINLSPQPHLDGTYTVFGRVIGSLASLTRITQGDVIRTIRR